MAKRNTNKDIEELENAFQKLSGNDKPKAGKYASKKPVGLPILIAAVVIAVVIAAIVGGTMAYTSYHNNQQITTNMTMAGYDVTGLTRETAQQVLQSYFDTLYVEQDMVVHVEDQTVTIPPSTSQVSVNIEALVDAAIAEPSTQDDPIAFDITPYMNINTEGVMLELNKLKTYFSDKLIQTSYAISGEVPRFVDKIDEEASVILEITKGQSGQRLDMDQLYHTVLSAYSIGVYEVVHECHTTEPDPVDWVAISAKHDIEPVEAVMDEETFEVTGGTYGYAFDPEEAEKAVNDAQYGETVVISFRWIKPENTADELKELLFRDVLSSYTTYASYDYDRNINLELAAAACNGIVLYPGDIFSFNDTLGERTPEKGYRPGASYVGGQTVYDYGGGICQVATTIYYCSVVADLEIVERECHGYASSYTPLSTDATVFWNGIDYKFKNNTNYPIRIEAYSSNGDVTVNLIGTDTKDYYVKFEYEWLDTYPFETVYEEMEADNDKGFKDGDVITTPYTGYKSQGFRARYDKETDELIERVLESVDVYSSRDKVICKIVGTEEPTTPEPTVPDPQPTDPPVVDDPTEPPVVDDPTEVPSDPPTEPSVSEEPSSDPEAVE